METLTPPEPAAGLWAAKRRIVHAIPPEMFHSNIPPHPGGGTILANHRPQSAPPSADAD